MRRTAVRVTIPIDPLLLWYKDYGRKHLPWRATRDPYAVVVAEFMLQQTQVDRVIPLYTMFLDRFPSFAALAVADAGDVMRAWRGLGYNSRAQRLRRLAQTVMARFGGDLPCARDILLALPGIGPYTAAAVRCFAFNASDAALDTNVRRVVHRVLFGLEFPVRVSQRELDSLASAEVPLSGGHDWNSAMMDLGALICTARAPKCLICPLRADCAAAPIDVAQLARLAKAHAKRSPQAALPFERTTRFLRGRIVDRLRDLRLHERLTLEQLARELSSHIPPDRVDEIPAIVSVLIADGIVDGGDEGVALCRF